MDDNTTIAISTTLTPAATPNLVSSEVGNVDANTLVSTFDINMSVTDGTGFSVLIGGATPNTIISASATATDISFVLTDAIVNGEVVTIEYDGLGNANGSTGGVLASFTAASVTNNVA